MADRVQETAERLYGLPLEDFVAERDSAAKALRKEKDRDAATAVAALPKPSAGAWAVNAIAREQPELRDELLAAGDAVREAQDAAVSGQGGGTLREAKARQRAAIDAVLRAASELRPAGRALSRAVLDRLRQTLQAAAGDEELREAIAAGRLLRDAEGGGAWPFGDVEPAVEPQPKPKPEPKAKARPAADDAERKAAERERREVAERRREIESRLAEARAERRARERELARAERDAERAAKRLEEAEAAAAEARAHADEAQAELRSAQGAVDHARDDAARLEEQLD